jgi:RNA polymerase sigma factor (sigma-70 family)
MPTIARRRDRLSRAQAHAAVLGAVPFAYARAGRRPGDRDENVSDAFLGLCQAATSFEPSRGLQFLTHADWWMTNQFTRRAEARRKGGLTYSPRNRAGVSVTITDLQFDDPKMRANAVPVTTDPPTDETAELWRRVAAVALCRTDYLMIRARYAHGLSDEQIALLAGVSPQRVRQRRARMMERLRENAHLFEGFL